MDGWMDGWLRIPEERGREKLGASEFELMELQDNNMSLCTAN